jgi:glycosyltransferase involved in cell wall biosynthesis
MHLLLLNYEFPPLGAGAGNATKALAREFVSMGHRVSVVTTWYKGLPDREEVDGYTVHRVHSRRRSKDRSNMFEMLHYVFLATRLATRLARSDRPDHTLAFFALPTGLIAWRLFRRFGIPYTLSLRGGDVPGFLPKDLWLHHIVTRPLNGVVWGNAVHIVANSIGLRDLAQKTARKYGREVECIPNGVNTAQYHPDTAKTHTPERLLSLLFVGRLVRQKGVTYILKALSDVCATESNVRNQVHLTVVGDGPLRDSLQEEARILGVADLVTWKGWFDNREALAEEYRKHDVFVFPSFEEGMPNVVLEAMASGLAIVATNIPGTNELVMDGQNGILIQAPDQLAQVLTLHAKDPAIVKKYGIMSRTLALRRGWEVIAQAYRTLLDASTGHPIVARNIIDPPSQST